MSTGDFIVVGAACPASAFVQRADVSGLSTEAVHRIQSRDTFRHALHSASSSSSSSSSSRAVFKLITSTVVLLEDGQVIDLNDWADYEAWVREGMMQLNAMGMKVIDVAVGGKNASSSSSSESTLFFIILTATGHVYVFGHNSQGQLGLGHRAFVASPTLLSKFAPPVVGQRVQAHVAAQRANIALAARSPIAVRIVAVAAGANHAVYLTSQGDVYACGDNEHGQCGFGAASAAGSKAVSTCTPRYVPFGRLLSADTDDRAMTASDNDTTAAAEIVHIVAAATHTAAIDANGRVWYWGHGVYKKRVHTPTLLQSLSPTTADDKAIEAVQQVALGDSHCLLLTQHGTVYALGIAILGCLGVRVENGSKTRVETPTQVSLSSSSSAAGSSGSSSPRAVQVFASAFSSATIDAHGAVWIWGGNIALPAQLSTSILPPSSKPSHLHIDLHRCTVFVPTRIDNIEPATVGVAGGTTITITGAALAPLAAMEHKQQQQQQQEEKYQPDTVDAASSNSEATVIVTYRGVQTIVPATYDIDRDALICTLPPLANKVAAAGAVTAAAGGPAATEAFIQVSTDGGAHRSNALRIAAFRPPTAVQQAKRPSQAVVMPIQPSSCPIGGGSRLHLYATYDHVSYPNIKVRFRSARGAQSHSAAQGAKHSATDDKNVIGVVDGFFNPAEGCIECIAPSLPPQLLLPSSSPAAAATSGRLRHAQSQQAASSVPPATHVDVHVDISLDGQCYVPFPASSSSSSSLFQYTFTSCSTVTPPRLPICGGAVAFLCSGVHTPSSSSASQLHVRFSLNNGYKYIDVPGSFVPLQQYRAAAATARMRTAATGRAAAAAALQRQRQREVELKAAAEAEEAELMKDPRYAREKAKAAAAAAAAKDKETAGSRPSSGPGLNVDGAAGGERTQQSQSAAAAATSASSNGSADAVSSTSSASVAPDEWAVLEAQVAARERDEDAAMNALSGADRTAVGYVITTAPSFIEAAGLMEAEHDADGNVQPQQRGQAVAVYISVNGGADFAPLWRTERVSGPSLSLARSLLLPQQEAAALPLSPTIIRVLPPTPLSLSPACGPITGDTTVTITGCAFYDAHNIAAIIKLLPPSVPAPATVTAAATTAGKATTLAASGTDGSRPSTAQQQQQQAGAARSRAPAQPLGKADVLVVDGSHAADDATAMSATTPSEFSVACSFVPTASAPGVAGVTTASDASIQHAIQFVTPSLSNNGVTSSSSPATVTVAFDPSELAPCTVALPFTFYSAPVVVDAVPPLIAQHASTEVTLYGRGFIPSGDIKLRLVMPDEDAPQTQPSGQSQKQHARLSDASAVAAAASTLAPSAADANVVSSARKHNKHAVGATDDIDPAAVAAAAAAAAVRRLLYKTIEVVGVYRANDSGEDEEARASALKRKQRGGSSGASAASGSSSSGGAAGGSSARKDAEQEIEAPTITFTVPPVTAFGQELAEGVGARVLEVELALNGQQYQLTPIVLRFEKDTRSALKKKAPHATATQATAATGGNAAAAATAAAAAASPAPATPAK